MNITYFRVFLGILGHYSIQYLNFAKKWFNSLFNSKNLQENSIQKNIQFKNLQENSIQKNIQLKKFNSKNIQFKNLQKNSIQNLIQNVEFGRIQFNNIFIQ